MKEGQVTDAGAFILFDRDRLASASSAMFDPAWWEGQAALIGGAPGRGTTHFVRHDGEEWALRHYMRGGLVARFVRDSYLWHGLDQTRAWREWRLTAALREKGLPVPAPVAARVIRSGIRYRCDLITVRLRDVRSLAERLQLSPLGEKNWHRLGATLRRFHDAGVDHADLNAHNILLAESGTIHLIDFDKAQIRGNGDWKAANLERLLRSLRKVTAGALELRFADSDWEQLRAGYSEEKQT